MQTLSLQETEHLEEMLQALAQFIFGHAAWAIKPKGGSGWGRSFIQLNLDGKPHGIEPVPPTVEALAAVLGQWEQFNLLDVATKVFEPETYSVG